MKINSYKFGKIVINNTKYNSDVIIHSNSVKSNWWRESGHNLSVSDLKDITDDLPDILVVGTGAYSLMKISGETIKFLKGNNVDLIIEDTPLAVKTYNKLSAEQKKVTGAFHLTC